MQKDILLCLSGGLDSSSLLFEYKDRIAMAVTFDYGSIQNKREQKSAKLVAEKAGIPWRLIDVKGVFSGFRSALLQSADAVPECGYDEASAAATVVPFRNGIFLSILAGLADSMDLKYVALASHHDDGFTYKDCRPEFSDAIAQAIKLGTDNEVEFFRPYINCTKREIAKRGIKAGLNPDWSYSCYKGGEEPCGVCSTCRARNEALEGLTW